MTTLPNKDLLRPDEVATYYSVSVRTIYTWIELGKLEAVKVAGKILRIKREEAINIQRSKCE
jgi:excisionase family DNA binding protein